MRAVILIAAVVISDAMGHQMTDRAAQMLAYCLIAALVMDLIELAKK